MVRVLFVQDYPGELVPQRTSVVNLELVTCDQSAEHIMILLSIPFISISTSLVLLVCIENVRFTVI